MPSSISEQKAQLRRKCKAIRRDLGEDFRRRASEAICAHLSAWDIFQTANVILSYMPMRSEVDLRSLLTKFSKKRWSLPRIIPEEDHHMVFHPYDPQQLVEHPFGMAEPAPHLPQILPEEIDLVLVPGLAYHQAGWRLGYGGGYFDRFLRDFRGVNVGVIFQALLLDVLPHGEQDIPVGWLVTENGVIRSGKLTVKPVGQDDGFRE